jgi:DNA-binding beta-propeller fold protein YncE
MRFRLFLAFVPGILVAQSIAVPHSGVVFDRSPEVFRPVLGEPGAAILGDALEIRGELHTASTCSQQQFALAAAGREGVVTLIHLDTLKTSALSPALVTAPNQIELSAACSAAAIYSAQANRLQIVTGLPSKPVIAADLTPDLPGVITSLAVSDDGQLVVAVVPGKAVYAVPASGRPVSLLSIKQNAVVAMHGNPDAIMADQSTNTVMLIANAAGTPAITTLAGSDAGIDSPSAVWFDSRTQRVIVANGGSGKVSLLPLTGGGFDVIACGCVLAGLSPVTDRTYQLQTTASGQPLRILDLGSTPARIVFVATPEPPAFPKGRRK